MTNTPDASQSITAPTGEPVFNTAFPPDWNYEVTVAEVEAIITQIELGELELADVFDQFTTAVEQLRRCETFLARQQQQVDLLIETLLDEPETL